MMLIVDKAGGWVGECASRAGLLHGLLSLFYLCSLIVKGNFLISFGISGVAGCSSRTAGKHVAQTKPSSPTSPFQASTAVPTLQRLLV
jgi:hypothetical protein